MFESSDTPRVFALPPGADFPAALVRGVLDRMAGQPPEAIARITIVVNTRRMARRVTGLFADQGPLLMPRILTMADLAHLPLAPLPQPTTAPLRRRLELARLFTGLIRAEPDLAGSESVFDLADSLASLIDEMHGEGVQADRIRSLDVSDLSGHWARAQRFIGIADAYLQSVEDKPDTEAAQRAMVHQVTRAWTAQPPGDPILVAGSTGSRGTMAMLIAAVARLPQGAAILPGFDFNAPGFMWAQLGDALSGEDHPQFRFLRIMQALDLQPGQIQRWTADQPAAPDRGRVISLALRPAPFTDAWLAEGPAFRDLPEVMRDVSLIEADSAREEAQSVALCLKSAAEAGLTAALITPDRMLTRQVAAALDRWDILPDDSAGMPLHLSPPGRLVRQVAELMCGRTRSDTLIALLKHPLTHTGPDRGPHLLHTRDLELHMRRNGPPHPEAADFAALKMGGGFDPDWLDWIAETLLASPPTHRLSPADWTGALITMAERVAAGPGQTGSGDLWDQAAGRTLQTALSDLCDAGPAGMDLSAGEYLSVLDHVLRSEVVRDRDAPDGRIMIWGTMEARVQGADLVILGGLNEGSWPESPPPDPWLNRVMRHKAGLLLPERRIGLSAHDWQQAMGAARVVLSRAKRSDDAETVPSRWLNRLTNLLGGLPDSGGDVALAQMRARGAAWRAAAAQLDRSAPQKPAPRPSPRPPVAARPTRLSVTEIKRLIRDPYAIYAKHVLRLRPLDPLVPAPDALLRGTVFHEILERFVKEDHPLTPEALMQVARDVVETQVAWPVARSLWLARMGHVADWFIEAEADRRAGAEPVGVETRMEAQGDGITLTGKVDRIDRMPDGQYRLLDYKTGNPPGTREQTFFDKQLLLEAAVLTLFGIGDLPPGPVAEARFLGLGRSRKEADADLTGNPPQQVWAEFQSLIAAYRSAGQGYSSRRAIQKEAETGDYDQLARFGEWDHSDMPEPEDLT